MIRSHPSCWALYVLYPCAITDSLQPGLAFSFFAIAFNVLLAVTLSVILAGANFIGGKAGIVQVSKRVCASAEKDIANNKTSIEVNRKNNNVFD